MSLSKHHFPDWPLSRSLHRANDQPTSPLENPTSPLSDVTFAKSDQDGERIPPIPDLKHRTQDILSIIAIIILLVWPWAFFGAIWAKRGVKMNDRTAKYVMNHPSATTYLVTLIGSIISLITGALFSVAILRLAQELATHRRTTQHFHLEVLLAFRYRTWPWRLKEFKYLMKKDRWWPVVLLIVCMLTFPLLISSTTSLIAPIPFNRTAVLTGTELDFSSAYADCQTWFNEHPLNNTCDYQWYKDLQYTNCLGENQMVDVLESGRGNILELVSNNTQSLTFSQLGGQGGLHFLGPIRGVLPIGPQVVPAFDTLKPSPISSPKTMTGMISYNYTLDHQGLSSIVNCSYAPAHHFQFDTLDPGYYKILTYNASCPTLGGMEILTNVSVIPAVNSNNFMAYWACQSAPNGIPTDSYSIYLAGLNHYAPEIGNITCTVNPIQTAIFPVTYQSTSNLFTVAKPTLPSPITFSTLMSHALTGLGEVISEGQNLQANLVAESVLTFGAKSSGPQLNQQYPPIYLRLFERMIQGVIEYEASYLRLIYSTISNPPPSCIRTVTGSVNYQVFGWSVKDANIGFLMPITLINLAALAVLALAMRLARTGGYIFRPLPAGPVTPAEPKDPQGQVPKDYFGNVERDGAGPAEQDAERSGQ